MASSNAARAAAALVLLAAAGCGPAAGEARGTVRLKGQPLSFGLIAFATADGQVVTGVVEDGRYAVRGLVPGPARVTVQGLPVMSDSGRPPRPAPPVAARYQDAGASGLGLTVRPGPQEFDADLAP